MLELDDIARADSIPGVMKAVERELSGRDVSFFSHRTFPRKGEVIQRSTLPDDWVSHYNRSNYVGVDPGIGVAARATRPVPMCFDRKHHSYKAFGRACDMFAEIETIGAHGSFFVPFKTETGAAAMNFFTDRPARAFDEWAAVEGPTLALYAAIAHTRISALVDEAPEQENPLAPRERECLVWLANGLKTDRIAERMSISPRTVEFHLKNARFKLGAATREQALAVAIVKRLIAL